MEAAIAQLLTRTPVQVAVAVQSWQPSERRPFAPAGVRQHALSECLQVHERTVQRAARLPCTLIIRHPLDAQSTPRTQDSSSDGLAPDGVWLRGAMVRDWISATDPLPLEWVQVAAAAVVRRFQDPARKNPIVEALRLKLAHSPPFLDAPAIRPRRMVTGSDRTSDR